MKYFYTDPLAAAWMAKHFGISFGVFVQPSGVRINSELSEPKRLSMFSGSNRFYIRPDSLHLLEQQMGDLVGDEFDCNAYLISHEMPHLRGKRIIQRNGIAFMWPETEK